MSSIQYEYHAEILANRVVRNCSTDRPQQAKPNCCDTGRPCRALGLHASGAVAAPGAPNTRRLHNRELRAKKKEILHHRGDTRHDSPAS